MHGSYFMKNKYLILILSPLLICFYTACHAPDKIENKTVFKYNEASGITSLDPAYSSNLSNIWACNQLFNGLVQLDSNLNIKPCIAKSWHIDEDGKKYTFILRNDVFFHNNPVFPKEKGRRVKANDFVFSFTRLLDQKTASPGQWVFNMIDSSDNKPCFKAVNDTILEIKLKSPFAPFLGILCMKYCSVIPVEAIQDHGKEFRKYPVGTGPFRFQMWKENIKLVLLKNENYFEFYNETRLPYLDAVSVSFLKDKQSAFLEFIKGNLDFMSGLDPNYKDELITKRGRLNPKYRNKINMKTGPYLNTEYLGILLERNDSSNQNNPLSNIYFRKAITYGFDRIKMMRYLRNNIGTPGVYGMIPPGLPSFDTNELQYTNYNPALAKKNLKLSGYNANEAMPITLETTPEYLDLCKFIQHQLGEIGINIKLNVNTPAAIKELKAQSKLGFFRASWIADYPDAENFMSLFYSKNFSPDGPNYTHFYSPVFDSLYEKSLSIVDQKKRFEQIWEMNILVMDKTPVIVLYYDQVLLFFQKNISGISRNPINMLDLRRVKKQTITQSQN